ncbi:MAG: OmpA family protein, partial [Bacteroidales bacterium]|nr:OmpA family protein [Bacteroidales bacterium]
KLLFRSGSFEVEAKGRDAIDKLSGVLEINPEIQILIEGHTDNVPYRGTSSLMIDNWDLSVKRATTIVRLLLQGSEIDPARLTAAGRSEYIPVGSNDTPEGKQKNRRIEIILSPRLDALYELISK